MNIYLFGIYEENVDGNQFREIARGYYDSLSQAEHQSRLILSSPDEYDILDREGKTITRLFIRGIEQ